MIVQPPLALWAQAFVLTCCIEIPIAMLVLRKPARFGARLGLTFAAQLMTHPALWYVAPRWEPYWQWLLVVEGLIWAAEFALYATCNPWRRALFASVAANAASTAAGLTLVAAGLV